MYRLALVLIVFFSIHVFAQPNISEEEISYSNGEIRLAASLLLPQSNKKLPAAVIVHGSGSSDRNNPWTAAYAAALSQRGVIVLHPDKRGSGKSSGNWRKASMEDLAKDAVVAVDYLLSREEVDTAKIALIGFSQGGHVIPIAATKSNEIDLVISISSSVVSLREQTIDEVVKAARREGVSEAEMQTIKKINEIAFAYAYGEVKWEQYFNALHEAKQTSLGNRKIISAAPAQKDIWIWDWLDLVSYHSPLEYWKQVSIPVLFIFGGNDTQIEIKKSIDLIFTELQPLKKNFSLLYFNNNGHALYRNDCNDFIYRWIEDGGAN